MKRGFDVPIKLNYVIPVLAVGVAAGAFVAAPTAAADNSEFCTDLNTTDTKCQKQGDVEINDSLSRANTLPQWASQGAQSGGPYDGTLGGGNR